jgi:methylamine dehydrogenase accessory protein MauD
MFLISQALHWGVTLLLAVAVFALARQVGILHERLAPLGALAMSRGPQAGEAAPKITARTLDEGTVKIGEALRAGAMQLLFFVAPTCPVCKTLLPTAKAFAESEGLDLVLVGDGEIDELRPMATRFGIAFGHFINSAEVGMAFQVGKLPHAILISELGIVVAQGLVNTREHLESLVVAHETGMRSVQDYLRLRKRAHDEASDVRETEKHV